MALTATQIQNAYVAFFNRPADVAGLNYWSTYAGNAADLLNTVAQSAEYKALYANMNNTQVVNAVYQNLFNHAPDVAGLNYWVSQLDGGALGIGNVADAINKGARGTDASIITNKVAAASAFTAALDTTAEILAYAGINATGISSVKAWLGGVTSDAASVTTATGELMTNLIKNVQSSSSSGSVGQTFTLTALADLADVAGSYRNGSNVPFDFKFTSGNEAVNATSATLTAVDSLADGSTADSDVLNVVMLNNVTTALVQNIENFNFSTSGSTAGGVVTLTGVSGVKAINFTGTSASNLSIAGTAVGNTGVTSIDASAVSTNVTFAVDSSTSTASADMTIKGVAVGANTITGGLGNDTITGGSGGDVINGGAGNDIIDAGNGANTVNGGSGNDKITTGTGADTITDTSGNNVINAGNGANTITVGSGNDTITGGSGVDTIITGGGNDVVQAAGGADVITLTNTATAGNSETIKFEATAAANGADTINTFLAGALSAGGDVLDVSAFVGSIQNYVEINGIVGGGNNVATSNVVVSTDTLALSQAAGLVLKASSNIVFIGDNGVDSTVTYVVTDANGTVVSANAVATLVGLADATTLVAAQII